MLPFVPECRNVQWPAILLRLVCDGNHPQYAMVGGLDHRLQGYPLCPVPLNGPQPMPDRFLRFDDPEIDGKWRFVQTWIGQKPICPKYHGPNGG